MLAWIFIILKWGHTKGAAVSPAIVWLLRQREKDADSCFSRPQNTITGRSRQSSMVPTSGGWGWKQVGRNVLEGSRRSVHTHTLVCRGPGRSGGQTVVRHGQRLWLSDEKPESPDGTVDLGPKLRSLRGYERATQNHQPLFTLLLTPRSHWPQVQVFTFFGRELENLEGTNVEHSEPRARGSIPQPSVVEERGSPHRC